MGILNGPKPKILILTVPHGASHRRMAEALQKALLEIQPDLTIGVIDALQHCAGWFRVYYNSYLIPLRFSPRLWEWIESRQHAEASSSPTSLYRWGAQPLFRFIESFDPDVVIATEVGTCEMAALLKCEAGARFRLVGAITGVDVDRAWAQPEVDLYPVAPGEMAAALEAAGADATRILPCGVPVDPAFASLPDRGTARIHLQVPPDASLALVLFGGAGSGRPKRILAALKEVKRPLTAVFVAAKNLRLQRELERLTADRVTWKVLGWVDNIHEWMAAADLLLSKPGASTLIEAINTGVPLLAFDPLPGNERRACDWIERHQIGGWAREARELAPTIEHWLGNPQELRRLRQNALALARPHAARDAARAILNLCESGTQASTRSG